MQVQPQPRRVPLIDLTGPWAHCQLIRANFRPKGPSTILERSISALEALCRLERGIFLSKRSLFRPNMSSVGLRRILSGRQRSYWLKGPSSAREFRLVATDFRVGGGGLEAVFSSQRFIFNVACSELNFCCWLVADCQSHCR